ncbi:hypothetical protein Prudu_518S000300 [Prunus dulcis]|uniref:Uncharacterized protein n=1 Tax=Prunus dulcis TaxID=3755 RepID=A0A5H2XKH0_PRUDU|nr:hypothetical protein Prudu_518S000300 [Prunus dulcis]
MIEPGFSKSVSDWIGTTSKNKEIMRYGRSIFDGVVQMFKSYHAKSPMARTIRDKPGLHHDLLTRFVISRRPLQTVAYEELRSSTYTKAYNSTAFVLHRFLGFARTWRSFSRILLSNLSSPSGWRMVLVDLRNRGRSAEIGEQLWVLDSLPGEVNPENRNKEVERVLHTLQSLPSSVPSRK